MAHKKDGGLLEMECGNCKINSVKKHFTSALKIIFVLMPCAYVLLLCWRFDMNIMNLPATVNDEIGWYSQAFAVVEYGKPLGYWGYNGTHAPVGTFGPWGASSIWFLALFLRGLKFLLPFPDFSIYIFNNIMWACTANLILILCAKPDLKKIVRFIVVYIFLFVNHTYIFVGMSETMRYAMMEILAAVTIFLWTQQNSRFYKVVLYGIAPALIIAFMSSYIMYALVLPVWILSVYKNTPAARNHKILFGAAGITFFFAVTVVVYYANGRVVSPYVINVLGDIIHAFSQGLTNGMELLTGHIRNNMWRCKLKYLWGIRTEDHGWLSAYLIIFYTVGIFLLASFAAGRKKMKATDWEFHGFGAYMMIGFLAAFIVLYNTTTHTLIRGINIALVYALFLNCMSDKATVSKGFIIVMILATFPFLMYLRDSVIASHRMSEDTVEYQQVFAEHIILDEKNEPWENTVALYGDTRSECMYLPVGTGINTMISGQANEHARYAVIWLRHTGRNLSEIKEAGTVPEEMWETHDLLYQGDDMLLMRNKASALPK